MGENIAKLWDGYAVYLPAIQQGSAEFAYKQKRTVRGGNLPSNMSLRDLDFLKKKSKFFYQKYGLYSVGQHSTSVLPKISSISERKRDESILIGDSGGFQLGMGTLKGLSAIDGKNSQYIVNAWKDLGELERVTRMSDIYFDFSMTLDAPLWAQRKENRDITPFGKLDTQQLIDLTYQHLKYHKENGKRYRDGTGTKWLNVLQGYDSEQPGSQKAWYDMAKQFEFEGWAFAGEVGLRNKKGIGNFIRQAKQMQLDGQFDGKEWVHFLGMTRLKWSVLFTAFQRVLRKTCSENIQVSYDSASHSKQGGQYDTGVLMPALTSDENSWSKMPNDDGFPIARKFAVDQPIYPLPPEYSFSPFYKHISLNDMNLRGDLWERRTFDSFSSQILITHNAYAYAKAFTTANQLAFSNKAADLKRVPQRLSDALGAFERIFIEEKWDTVLTENIELLDDVFAMKTGR
jgi:hypothetical protein